MVEFVRRRNARDYAVTTPNSVDEAKYVELGGISAMDHDPGGEKPRQPRPALFLHGGPGDATNPWSYAVFRSWLKHFTVVQWISAAPAKH